MFNLKNWETFSHTHRSFDFDEILAKEFVNDLKKETVAISENFYEILFLEDKDTIEGIYDLSSLPATDKHKFENFTPRKNSQLLAPLVVIAIPKKYDHNSLARIGELYSRIAHSAISKGFQTGFCICYENDDVESLLLAKKHTQERRQLNQIPFLAIGHQLQNVPWNFQTRDVNTVIKSYSKIDAKNYITII